MEDNWETIDLKEQCYNSWISIHTKKMSSDPYLTPYKNYIKINWRSKCKSQNIKVVEENRRKIFFYELDKDLLDTTLTGCLLKLKFHKLDFIKIKNVLYKYTVREMKGQYKN